MADTNDFVIPSFDIDRNADENWPDLDYAEKAFAYEYLSNGYDHRAAAEKAGLNPSKGIRMVRNPLVKSFIDHLQSTVFASNIITKQFVESQYLSILPKLMGEEEVAVVDPRAGTTFNAKKFHSSEIVSVLRDLSKVVGYGGANDDQKRRRVVFELAEYADDEHEHEHESEEE